MPITHSVGSGLGYILGTSLISVRKHHGRGNVEPRTGTLLGISMIGGVLAGQAIVLGLDGLGLAETVIRWFYVLFLLFLGGLMFRDALRPPASAQAVANSRLLRLTRDPRWPPPRIQLPGQPAPISVWLPIVAGLGAGLLSGILGVGGGVVIVPTLIHLLGFSTLMAVGTSLLCILIASPVGVLSYGLAGRFEPLAVVVLLVGSLIGAPLGVAASHWVRSQSLRLLYGVTLLLGAISVILKLLGLVHCATILILVSAGGVAVLVLALALRARLRAERGVKREA
jgi:uncharacterized membrane protein YfcA